MLSAPSLQALSGKVERTAYIAIVVSIMPLLIFILMLLLAPGRTLRLLAILFIALFILVHAVQPGG